MDVPQADSFPAIRRLVEELARPSGGSLQERTGFSDRHIRYRLQAARILGLVDQNRQITARGERLLTVKAGTPAERRVLVQALRASTVLRELAPNLLDGPELEFDAPYRKVMSYRWTVAVNSGATRSGPSIVAAATEGVEMAKGLRPQLRRFFEFMSTRAAGQLVNAKDILDATGWEPDTLATHVRKNKLDMFLAQAGPDQFRVLRDGQSLSMDDVARAFTQVSPGQLTLVKGLELTGEKGKYSLRKDIGHGAVAHVWEAVAEGSSAVVAVKIMNPRPDLLDPMNLPNVRQRFRRESRNGMKLDHPRVIAYRDVGETSGFPFVVMDKAEESLASLLRNRSMTVAESLDVIIACCEGLEYLHAAGCVHRDVKPPNILLFKRAGYVLGDLGIVLWSDMNPAFTSAGTITRGSIQLGSWYYMAPEQRHSPHEAVPRSDVYALGVTWYEALTGQTLDPAAIAAKRYQPAASEPNVNELLASMLEFAPADRPEVSALKLELLRLKRELGPSQGTFSFAQ